METLKDKRISFIFRNRNLERNSIEELFGNLIEKLNDLGYGCNYIQLPHSGASINSVIKNLLFIRKNKAPIFHITGDVNYVALALKKNVILTVHDVGSILRGNIIKVQILKLFWFWIPSILVKKITVISNESKKELEKIIPLMKKKIEVIYNPVNSNLIRFDRVFNKDLPVILHLGTKENKNLERTIEALSNIICEFVIIGRLNDYQTTLLNQFNINYRNVHSVPYSDIINYYKNCDIVSFASTYEGFGMPIVEAQKIGRPVVTSNISSMPEIAGSRACLVNPYSIKEIKSAFEKIIENPNYRENLISSGYKNVERFNIDIIVEQYIKLYQQILYD